MVCYYIVHFSLRTKFFIVDNIIQIVAEVRREEKDDYSLGVSSIKEHCKTLVIFFLLTLRYYGGLI